jgi:phenylacetic acid degradation operon negative regulatory protein
MAEHSPGAERSPSAEQLDLRPLTARSVILSVLLGTHPPLLPVRALVRTAELFDISEGTTRVALSRLVSDGDVVAEDSSYRLSTRLLSRQRRQDEGLRPATRPWRGGWEIGIAAPEVRGAAAMAALAGELRALRLAQLRPGVWLRPDNLDREWTPSVIENTWRVDGRAVSYEPNAFEMVAALWDLDSWAVRAEDLMGAMEASAAPAQRFVVAAAIVRHIEHDPVLPQALLPRGWPGSQLRSAYEAYERELRELLRRERARHDRRS